MDDGEKVSSDRGLQWASESGVCVAAKGPLRQLSSRHHSPRLGVH